MKRWTLYSGAILVSAIAVAALVLGQSSKPEAVAPANKKIPVVEVQAVEQQAIEDQLVLTGKVIATRTVTVRAMTEGPIEFFPWREGDRVQAGERLVEIHRPLYQQEVASAEAALALARAKLADMEAGTRPEEIARAVEAVTQLKACSRFNQRDLDRTRKLVQHGSLPGEALDKVRVDYVKCSTDLQSAEKKLEMLRAGPTVTQVAVQQAAVQEARAKLGLARAKFAETRINAPFAGIVTKTHVNLGDLATAKAPLLDLMDPESLVVRFEVPETAAVSTRPGLTIHVTLDAAAGRSWQAKVSRIYPQLNEVTHTRTVEARLDHEDLFLPGMFARVQLVLEQRTSLVVPDRAVLTRAAKQPFVFIVVNGKALRRSVRLGIEQGDRIEITAGLSPGDMVVVGGNSKLKDGDAAKVMKTPDQSKGNMAQSKTSCNGTGRDLSATRGTIAPGRLA